MMKCSKCSKEAEYDSPDNLCNEHWLEWFNQPTIPIVWDKEHILMRSYTAPLSGYGYNHETPCRDINGSHHGTELIMAHRQWQRVSFPERYVMACDQDRETHLFQRKFITREINSSAFTAPEIPGIQ
jgi:hypothetical protein